MLKSFVLLNLSVETSFLDTLLKLKKLKKDNFNLSLLSILINGQTFFYPIDAKLFNSNVYVKKRIGCVPINSLYLDYLKLV